MLAKMILFQCVFSMQITIDSHVFSGLSAHGIDWKDIKGTLFLKKKTENEWSSEEGQPEIKYLRATSSEIIP